MIYVKNVLSNNTRAQYRFPDMMAASMPAIAPALDEALAKEMAKAGQDVSVFHDRLRGLGWLTRSRQKQQEEQTTNRRCRQLGLGWNVTKGHLEICLLT